MLFRIWKHYRIAFIRREENLRGFKCIIFRVYRNKRNLLNEILAYVLESSLHRFDLISHYAVKDIFMGEECSSINIFTKSEKKTC